MSRVRTGIPGFDNLVDGGLVPGSVTMIVGPHGSGKSIFGLQYLYAGAIQFEEPGILVTLETRPADIRRAAVSFGWDIELAEASKGLVIIDAASNKAGLPTSESHALRRGFDMANLAEEIYITTKEINAKRLVIDSLYGLGLRFTDPLEVRTEVFRLSALLNELGLTSLLLSESGMSDPTNRIPEGQFVPQGLILFRINETRGSFHRSLLVWKLQYSSHSMNWHQFFIEADGFHVGAVEK
ncbi:MAG: hypothetical protein K9W43_00510 [Candidatus Thorarchaeota archaeon]|nr:hypothetical protein [Candidatus Thorarchaeota archaeon]